MVGKGRTLTIVVVVTHNQLLQLAVLAKLTPKILVEGVEVVLGLRVVHAVLGVVRRVLVHVGHQDGLAVRRLDVLPAAAIAMATGADLEVEAAVDLARRPCSALWQQHGGGRGTGSHRPTLSCSVPKIEARKFAIVRCVRRNNCTRRAAVSDPALKLSRCDGFDGGGDSRWSLRVATGAGVENGAVASSGALPLWGEQWRWLD